MKYTTAIRNRHNDEITEIKNPLIRLIKLLDGIAYADRRLIKIEIPITKFICYMETWERLENGKEKKL